MRNFGLIFFLLAFTAAQVSVARGDLVVENIVSGEQVNQSGSLPNSQGMFFKFPPSPNAIDFSQTASIPPSFSTGTYDLSWSGDVAHFQSSIDHHLQGFVGGLNSNSGILIRPAIDSFVSLTGTWTYNHDPAQIGRTVFGMRVSQVGAGFSPWSDQKRGGTHYLLPSSGTLDLSGSAVLQAGVLYSVGYNISTDNFNTPPANATWLGNGFIDITVAPIPEPAAAILLAAFLPMAGFRHRRRPVAGRR